MIYDSKLVRGLFGVIHLNTRPMVIEVNRTAPLLRRSVALVHELLHMLDEMLKLRWKHAKLHRAAALLYSRVYPLWKDARGSEERLKSVVSMLPSILEAAEISKDSEGMPALASLIDSEVFPTLQRYEES